MLEHAIVVAATAFFAAAYLWVWSLPPEKKRFLRDMFFKAVEVALVWVSACLFTILCCSAMELIVHRPVRVSFWITFVVAAVFVGIVEGVKRRVLR